MFMSTPISELTKDAPGLSAASFEGTIKAYFPLWDGYFRPYLLESVHALPADRFDFKPRPEMLTASQVILHIAEAERWWVSHVVDGEPYEDDVVHQEDPTQGWATLYDAPDHNALLFRLEEAHRHTQRWFGFPPANLSKLYTRTREDGSKRDYTLHWILEHVQEHELHPRAQLNLYLRLMGITPPSV
jgi:uncharacterized damage-inducible protein DinB